VQSDKYSKFKEKNNIFSKKTIKNKDKKKVINMPSVT
jgi:hypothetical protein